MFFPKENIARRIMTLDGLWRFSEDRNSIGVDEKWYNGLPNHIDMAVPGSWNEQYPYLYGLNVVLNANDKIVDCYEHTFCIKEIEVSGNNILLNGEKIFLRVFGNHKGVFTRDREPKMVAHFLKEHWTGKKISLTMHKNFKKLCT